MITYSEITDSVTVCRSDGALVNAVILHRPGGVVVVDTLLRPADSKELGEKARSYGPVRYLLNTHWHSDHCYGARAIREDGTLGISQEKYWDTISRERYVLSPNRKSLLDKHNLPRPEITFADEYRLEEPFPLVMQSMPGHTPDSTLICLPEEGIVITGDTVLNSDDGRVATPYFYWGDLDDQINATETLIDMNPELIIPGHGIPTIREKIMLDGIYLDLLKGFFEDFIREVKTNDFPTLREAALQAIPVTDCLPGSELADIWVPRMHELNVERLLRSFLKLGDD